MSINRSTILSVLRRKSAVAFLLAGSAIGAFAIKPIVGDGDKKQNHSLLLNREVSFVPGTFTLKTHYNYRGSNIINQNKQQPYINLNTVVTYQKGKTTYVLPLKKRVYINSAPGFGITVNR